MKLTFFWKSFFHFRVLGFLLIGIGVMFLTFMTLNNAFELMISAVASVFIGIGVNNYSSMYTHLQDERKRRSATRHSIRFMKLMQNRISLMKDHCETERMDLLRQDLVQLEEAIGLTIDIIAEQEV